MRCKRCGRDECAKNQTCPSRLAIEDAVYWTGGSQDLPPVQGVFLGFNTEGRAKFESTAGKKMLVEFDDLTLCDRWPVLMS